MVDIQGDKNFYLFPNEFSQDCYIERDHKIESIQEYVDQLIFRTLEWYKGHWQGSLEEIDLCFITNNYKQYNQAKEIGVETFTIQEFVEKLCAGFPNMIDYLGMIDIDNRALMINNKDFVLNYDEH